MRISKTYKKIEEKILNHEIYQNVKDYSKTKEKMRTYLAVRYLSEILSFDEFKKLMFNFSDIKKFGDNLINKMFEYYDNKLSI